jgi:predicted glycoside hydrolase/deacetylase ChbG (UPF0249 family)
MAVCSPRKLVVNADDFGRSAAINAGVIRAHTHGIVTSASLMVRHPAAREAAAATRENPGLGLGLHLDLTEWEEVAGEWRAKYTIVDTDDRRAVTREVDRQLEGFRVLVGADPDHLDSHQHVHRNEPVRSVAVQAAATLAIPLRELGEIRFCGAFYGQGRHGELFPEAITPGALAKLLSELPPGATELCCHPATRAEAFTSYSVERPLELEALCDPAVRRAIRECEIELCSFGEL